MRALDNQPEILQQIRQEKERLCSLVVPSEKHYYLDLARLTHFEWDTVYFSMPYRATLLLVSKIGFEADALACSRSGLYDEWTQMIFESKGKVVMFFDFSSYIFDHQAMLSFSQGRLKSDSKILVSCH